MKVSSRQKAASESINQSIIQAIELATNTKKQIEKTAKWFLQTKAYLKKIAEATAQLQTGGKHIHPLIESTAIKTMHLTESSMNVVYKVISSTLINQAENYAQQCAHDISEINNKLKQYLNQTCELYEEYFVESKTNFQTDIRSCASVGYDTHCTYLRYSHDLDDIDSQFRSSFNVLKEIDNKMLTFEHDLWEGLNEVFLAKVPHAAKADPAPPCQYHDKEFENIMATFQLGIQGFRMPYSQVACSYNFEQISLKMKAKKSFDGKKVGEISVSENEVIDVIDSSLAEFYKIRNANGNEGYVPVTVLEPIVQNK